MVQPYKKDGNGIVFDMGTIQSLQNPNMSWEQLIKYHPLYNDQKRINHFRGLIDNPEIKVKWNNPDILKARKHIEDIIEHNQKLIDRGLNPQDKKDRMQFKDIDKNILNRVAQAFGATI